jgi:glycosyltransferase involved in cell wall biosynthesis
MNSPPRPAKIVRIIARLNTGGPAIHSILLTRELNSERFSSRLVTGVVSPGEGDMGSFAVERGVRPIMIPALQRDPRLLDDLRAFVRICRIVFATRPDIIHTHTAKAGALGRAAGFLYNLCARLTGRPRAVICHTFHGHLFHGYFPRWISTLLMTGERLLALITDRIITVSEQLKHELTNVYRICGEEKCSVVPVGLDFQWTERLPATRGVLRREAGVPTDCLAVGIVGRLTTIKNHELFLRAASACRVAGARFFVIGDGERRAALGELSDSLGLNGRVVFTGWQHDLAKVYSDLDIVCLTSLNEGTPVALIEAMAAGVPVVATRVGGVSDLMVGSGSRTRDGFELFSNGILVPADGSDLFGVALEFLAARPDLRRAMGISGKSFVRERFSIERLVSQVENLYLDLLARERS